MNRLRPMAAASVLAGLLLSGCHLQPNDNTLPGQVAVGDDGYSVTVRFDQVENLVPNSTVQKDNVVIGTVASIDVEDWQAVVELRLRRDVPLPADAMFSIGQKTLLGAQYVEVAAPPAAADGDSSDRLSDGDVVPTSQTGTYPATEQVLGAVALLLNNGGLSQISTITGELSTALRDRVPDTRAFVDDANQLLTVLDDNKGAIVSALDSLDRLSAGLRDDREQIGTAIDRITPGLRALEEERVRLVNALTAAGRASTHAVGVVRATRATLLGNLDALQPILTHLGAASRKLPEALKIGLTIPFPVMTTTNAIRGDYANLFATIDLRGASLSHLLDTLGGIPTYGQAGDPLQDPLTSTVTTPTTPTTRDPGRQRHTKPGRDHQQAPSSPADDTPCLLSLIGLC